MERMCRFSRCWLQKMPVWLVILGLSIAKDQAQIGTPPNIAVQPVGIAVQNGDTAVLTATATSVTSMKFYWYFNGQPVSAANACVTNVAVPLVGTVSTLTLSNVTSANAGAYSLRITNGVGSAISSNATLIVLASAVSNVVNFVSSGTGLIVSGFKVQLSGPAGSNYVIEASTDLKNWTPIATNFSSTGSVTFTDTVARTLPFRVYRAKTQ